MNSRQYEELCRFYVAQRLNIPIHEVKSVSIPNPQRPGLPAYEHQIDLYWDVEDPISRYLCIANAKWRGNSKVDQPDILLLQQVRQKTAAHKALMMTNSGFTSGAIAAAYDDGIGLHIVLPGFDTDVLPIQDRAEIQHSLQVMQDTGVTVFNANVASKSFQGLLGDEEPNLREGDVEAWVTLQLQRRLDYLRFLATRGYSISAEEIKRLASEIEERKRV